MRIAFLHSDKPRERILADAWLAGARAHGHETVALPLPEEPSVAGDYDVACMVGVKSRELFQAHHRQGLHVIYFDKGYVRTKRAMIAGWEYWRISIDAHQPTERLAAERHPSDRLEALELDIKRWRKRGNHILIAGSSAKYHAFYGLKEPTTYARDLVRDLRAVTDRPLVYRPKPSWREAVPIRKTRFSTLPESIGEALNDAHCLVTHGSNACFEAMVAGVPSVILGPAVAAPISSTRLSDIKAPKIASDRDRMQLLANLAYWQFTQAEMASGEAWAVIGAKIHV